MCYTVAAWKECIPIGTSSFICVQQHLLNCNLLVYFNKDDKYILNLCCGSEVAAVAAPAEAVAVVAFYISAVAVVVRSFVFLDYFVEAAVDVVVE